MAEVKNLVMLIGSTDTYFIMLKLMQCKSTGIMFILKAYYKIYLCSLTVFNEPKHEEKPCKHQSCILNLNLAKIYSQL